MANGNFRHLMRMKIRHHPNDQTCVVFSVVDPDVSAAHIFQVNLAASMCEYMHAIGVAWETFVVGSAPLNVLLMRYPVGAARPFNRLPIVILPIPNEAIRNHDVATHAISCGYYPD